MFSCVHVKGFFREWKIVFHWMPWLSEKRPINRQYWQKYYTILAVCAGTNNQFSIQINQTATIHQRKHSNVGLCSSFMLLNTSFECLLNLVNIYSAKKLQNMPKFLLTHYQCYWELLDSYRLAKVVYRRFQR